MGWCKIWRSSGLDPSLVTPPLLAKLRSRLLLIVSDVPKLSSRKTPTLPLVSSSIFLFFFLSFFPSSLSSWIVARIFRRFNFLIRLPRVSTRFIAVIRVRFMRVILRLFEKRKFKQRYGARNERIERWVKKCIHCISDFWMLKVSIAF